MRSFICFGIFWFSMSVSAQTHNYKEIQKKYAPLEIISLNYGSILNLRNILTASNLPKAIDDVAKSVLGAKPKAVTQSIISLKTFILTNIGSNSGNSFSHLEFHLKDTIVVYQIASDRTNQLRMAAALKNEVYYWVIFIDRGYVSYNKVENSKKNIKLTHVGNSVSEGEDVVIRSLSDIKKFEKDPFVTAQQLGGYKQALSNFIYQHPSALEEIRSNAYYKPYCGEVTRMLEEYPERPQDFDDFFKKKYYDDDNYDDGELFNANGNFWEWWLQQRDSFDFIDPINTPPKDTTNIPEWKEPPY